MKLFFNEIINSAQETFHIIFNDIGVVLLLIIAPTIYGFFYAWPMETQVPQKIPAAIVDYDQSNLSRNIIRYAAASPKIDPIVMHSEQEAQNAMWNRKIEGFMVIPRDLKHDISLNKSVKLNIYANGSYALINKSISYGFLETIGTVSAGIELKKLMAQGMTLEQANVARNPLDVQMKAHYNVSEGYGSYLVPAVSILVLQQNLIIAVAMFIASLVERGQARTSVSRWIGRILVFSFISWIICLFYFGWVFYIQDFARGGNILSSLVHIALFSPCVAIIGSLIGLLLKERERCMYIIVFLSLPIYFLCGISWPSEAMPEILNIIRWIFPSTSSVHISLRLNQMGASLYDVRYYLLNLFIIGCIAFSLLAYFGQPQNGKKLEN
ncbi:ABC transporter permease [Neisseriaceae bacterium PsAf]|nr:ABC transporter permease [Neisseriaceae bacterium PsAf]